MRDVYDVSKQNGGEARAERARFTSRSPATAEDNSKRLFAPTGVASDSARYETCINLRGSGYLARHVERVLKKTP